MAETLEKIQAKHKAAAEEAGTHSYTLKVIQARLDQCHQIMLECNQKAHALTNPQETKKTDDASSSQQEQVSPPLKVVP